MARPTFRRFGAGRIGNADLHFWTSRALPWPLCRLSLDDAGLRFYFFTSRRTVAVDEIEKVDLLASGFVRFRLNSSPDRSFAFAALRIGPLVEELERRGVPIDPSVRRRGSLARVTGVAGFQIAGTVVALIFLAGNW